jgi:hypothetical protein
MFKIKRGDTFIVEAALTQDGEPQDLTGWSIRSQVRRGNKLVADLAIELEYEANGAAYSYLLSAPEGTTEWPVGTLRSDIEYTMPSGQIASTETFEFECVEDVTR